MIKQCIACEIAKPLAEFYAHRYMADGHLNKCKECFKLQVRTNRRANVARYREYDKGREQRPERKLAKLNHQRTDRAKNKQHHLARGAVCDALRSGRLVRQPCEVCGERAEAHHDDYGKPLDVRWLCTRHHKTLCHGAIDIGDQAEKRQ